MEKKCFVVCEVCKLGREVDVATLNIAKRWGFFSCGMAMLPHKGETTVNSSVLVTEDGRTFRRSLITGQEVE